MREIKKEKVWNTGYTFGEEARDAQIRAMASAMGVSELFAVLLWNRGYRTAEEAERFLRLEQAEFHDPFLMADMQKAVDRIFEAVESGERITVYGDYDVDGVTSVTVLYLYLQGLGADVRFRIPKREGEGYGVSCAAIRELAEDGTTLVITVDTGITAVEEVAYAATLGMDFVITDHHECREVLPAARAVVNPHRPDCAYPFKELAGVGVVFKLLCACESVRSRAAGEPILNGVRRICMEYADLTAVGTVADVMPVIDENRMIVSLGLKLMAESRRPGLAALIEASSTRKSGEEQKKITSGMIGFGIAPRINAAGRISDAAIAVELLLEQDEERARDAAEELCEINRRRQAEENRISAEAYAQIEDLVDLEDDPVIVLESDRWHPGIIGIVASRITERYGLPSILVSFDGMEGDPNDWDDGKGSGRSIKGMNLVEALTACGDLLVKYGGHELAAGLTVKRGNLEAFRKRINEYARAVLSENHLQVCLDADCELSARDVNLAFAKELTLLEPFGVGNATPTFVMHAVTVKRVTGIGGGKHCRLLLEKDGVCMTALFFGVAPLELGLDSGDVADVLFHLDVNLYNHVESAQLILQDARPAKVFTEEWNAQVKRYGEIRGGEGFSVAENVIPDREEFAAVYRLLRHEFRNEQSLTDTRRMLKQLNGSPIGGSISYIKLKYILRILNELKICEIKELDSEIYEFEVYFNASKTSIEKSSILKKLKSQCYDRARQEQ